MSGYFGYKLPFLKYPSKSWLQVGITGAQKNPEKSIILFYIYLFNTSETAFFKKKFICRQTFCTGCLKKPEPCIK